MRCEGGGAFWHGTRGGGASWHGTRGGGASRHGTRGGGASLCLCSDRTWDLCATTKANTVGV